MGRRDARQKINREMKHKTKKMGRQDQDKKKGETGRETKKKGDETQEEKKWRDKM